MSFSIDLHYCGDQLRGFSLFEKAKNCEHGEMAFRKSPKCPMHARMKSMQKKGCCHNKAVVIKGQEHNSTVNGADIVLAPHFQFLTAYAISYLRLYTRAEAAKDDYRNYKPPLIQVDIPVFIQTFLI